MKYLTLIPALLVMFLLTGNMAIADVPAPEIPRGEGDKCVEPTDVMRRDHMEFILHQRDETMYKGIRTKQHSFKECISCHVVKDDTGKPVNHKSEKHFCNSCHSYASVKIDCFDCHASTPTKKKTSIRGMSMIKGHTGE